MDQNVAPHSSKSFLRVDHVWVRKGGLRGYKWIVKDVSFEVKQGEFVAIIGPNGAGKTKLMEAIVGDRPYAGRVALYSQDLYAQPEHWLRHIGWVPSYNVLHDTLRAEQALYQVGRLRLPSRSNEEIQRRIDLLLDHLEFPLARRHATIRELSSGERKRLDLCAELLTNPPLLLLDEPTTNLDPDAERYLMELLRNRSWGRRQSVVVVTHTLQSLYLCDRVLFLAQGRIRAEGTHDQVLAQLERKFQTTGATLSSAEPGQKPDIYSNDQPELDLVADEASRWASIYRQTRTIENETIDAPPMTLVQPETKDKPSFRIRTENWWHQMRVLMGRNWLLFINNLPALGLYLLLGPFSGLLSRIVLRDNAFLPDIDSSGYSSVFDTTDARQAIFIIALVVTLLGLIGSFLEITKERPIYRYERIKGLSPWAYLLSKWILLSLLVGILAPSFLFLVLTIQGQVIPSTQFVLATLYLACIASVTLGLAISAAANNERAATGLLGIVVVFNLFFSGGVDFNERFRFLLERISVFAASHWAAEGLSSGVQLYCWASNPRFQDFFSYGHLISIWLYLLVFILIALVAGYLALRMGDTWFVPRERLRKALFSGHVWSVIPFVLLAFSWGLFLKARSLDYYHLRVDEDNVRIVDFRNRDLFQSISGVLSQSNCPLPTPLPPPATPIVAIPPTLSLDLIEGISETPAPLATEAGGSKKTPTPLSTLQAEDDFLPLPGGSIVHATSILFGPEHTGFPLETLPQGTPLLLLGKDRAETWYRVKEGYTGRGLVGWVRVDDTDFLPSQTGSVAHPPSCATPRAYLENDGQTPAGEWNSDVTGHVVIVVDLFRDDVGPEFTQGQIAIEINDERQDIYPLTPTQHSFLFRGLVIDVPIQTRDRIALLVEELPSGSVMLHLRASIFYVPGGCSF